MKKRVLAAGACLLMLSTMRADADVPVIDPTSIAQQIQQLGTALRQYALQLKQYIGEELSWAVQAQQYATQVQQYATETAQLLAFVHNPNLGQAMGLLNRAGLGSAFPISPYSVMNMMNGRAYGVGGIPNIAGIFGPLAALSGSTYAANHIYSPVDNGWNSQQLISSGNAIAGTQGTALASYQMMQDHEASMQALRDRLTTATTPKDVQDVQAEIALEQNWTANQQASLTAVQITAAAQNDARIQRDNEGIDQGIDAFMAQATAAGRGL